MKTTGSGWLLRLAIICAFLAAGSAIGEVQIKAKPDSKVTSGNVEVARGETLQGDVVSGSIDVEGTVTGACVALGGPVTIKGHVQGDVCSIGGPILITGEVNGDVASVGGDMVLGPGALVHGDVTAVNGRLTKENGALVKGKTANVNIPLAGNLLGLTKLLRGIPTIPMNSLVKSESFSYSHRYDWSFLSFIIGMGIITVLMAALLRRATENIAGTIQGDFWKSAGIGLLIHILFIPGLLFLIISIAGIPLIPLGVLLYFVAGFMSLTAFSLVFARKFFEALKKPMPSTVPGVLVGYLLLNLVMVLASPLEDAGEAWDTLAGILVCANLMLVSCGWFVGLGAAWSTRLGSRPALGAPVPVVPATLPLAVPSAESPHKARPQNRKRRPR